MRLSSLDNLRQEDDLAGIRQNSRKIIVLIPALTPVAFDTDMQSGNDVSSGDGTGQSAVWTVYEYGAFIMPVTQNLITYGQVPSGVEVGDVIFHVSLREEEVIQKAYANPNHYVYIDFETFRITSLAYTDTGQRKSLVCGCKHFTPPLFRCKGY
jgi:hypothetical protein